MNVKSLCLGSLCLKDSSGYEIKKLFESAFSHFYSASYGSIYPALNRLLDEELVSVSIEPGGKHPDKKLYHITPAGKAAFIEELAATPPQEQLRSGFLMLMFFAHLLESDRLTEVLDEMEEKYEAEIAYLESLQDCGKNTPGMRFTVEFGLNAYRHSLQFIRDQRADLIARHTQGVGR